MSTTAPPASNGALLGSWPGWARWLILLAGSIAVASLLHALRLPAAFMLGPLIAAVLLQTAGGAVTVPRNLSIAAQAVIGCLIARSITPTGIASFAHHWPAFVAVVFLSISASCIIGWSMGRWRVIPGSTAVWGMLPGAATVMTVMARAYGADFRLVAFMQYLRVVLVAGTASIVALLFAHGNTTASSLDLFPPIHPKDFALTVMVALVGGGLGRAIRIPAGVLLGPLALGAVLNATGWVSIELPPVILISSYALIGWNIGLYFTRDLLAAAARALPQSIGATVSLMIFSAILAWLLVELLHVDPLTAYLATSPGGADAAAIIAASTKVDMSFVMAVQTLRVIALMALGPSVARWVAGMLPGTEDGGQPSPG